MPDKGNVSKFASAAFGESVESHDLPPHQRVQTTGRKPNAKGTRNQRKAGKRSGHRHVAALCGLAAACGGRMGSHDLPPHRPVGRLDVGAMGHKEL
ncbi:MAG: hypothetical protein VXU46_03895 [Planctomycetota bacterium]|nr:hypothetical protein [Planctomycetota bacterium]